MRIYFEGPILIAAAFILVFILLLLRLKYKKKIVFLIFFSIFYIYICQLFKYTQFPLVFVPELRGEINVFDNINLIPSPIGDARNAILNFIMTIPFGFLLPFVKKMNKLKIFIWAVFLPLILEGLQLFIGLITAYSERMIDINDIIFNFLGVLSGYCIFIVFTYLIRLFIDERDIEKESFLGYIRSL